MSFAPEVIAAGNGNKWAGNALRFATHHEAERWAIDLSYRWLAVVETRVVESTDPVNYSYGDNGSLTEVCL